MKHIIIRRVLAAAILIGALLLLLPSCGTPAQTAVPYVTESQPDATETTAPEERLTETTAAPTTEPPTEPTTEPPTEPPTETTAETPTETTLSETTAGETTAAAEGEAQEYVVNTNSGKFHYPTCDSVKDMKAKNRSDRVCTRDDLLTEGFVPCKRCNP